MYQTRTLSAYQTWQTRLTQRQTEVLVILGDDSEIDSEASWASRELAHRPEFKLLRATRGLPGRTRTTWRYHDVAADHLMTY